MIREQPRRVRPVACREHVSHGLDGLPLVSEPPRGPAVEVRNLVGQRSAELQSQEIRQKLVVAKPGALSVERHDERVRFLQFQQHLLRARAASQQVGELAVHPVDQ